MFLADFPKSLKASDRGVEEAWDISLPANHGVMTSFFVKA